MGFGKQKQEDGVVFFFFFFFFPPLWEEGDRDYLSPPWP